MVGTCVIPNVVRHITLSHCRRLNMCLLFRAQGAVVYCVVEQPRRAPLPPDLSNKQYVMHVQSLSL